MKPTTTPFALLASLAIAAALALGGCGGSEDDGGGGAGESQTTSRPDPAAGGAQQGDGNGEAQQQGAGAPSGRGEGLPARREAPIDTASLAAPVEGSERAAPGVPVSNGGDNSIQTWGLEASAAQREEVTATLQAFYDARAEADWATACSYLAGDQRAEFAGFVRGRSGNAACAEAMRALAQGVPERAFDREARIDYVLSLRVGRGNAFLIYTRPGEPQVYANAFVDEDGSWKVVSVGPTVVYR